jgi:hypothetical protein
MSADVASAIESASKNSDIGLKDVEELQRQAMVICGSVSWGEVQGGVGGAVGQGGGANHASTGSVKELRQKRRRV